MLTSLRLINWRSHKDSLFEFRKGTNLLIGIMGSGKSSVLHAICFALFGTFPSIDRRRMKLEDLLRLNEDKSTVRLEFEWENSKYVIERKLEKKKSLATSAEIFKDGRLIETGSTNVTAYVESILKIDYDLFTRAIYSEQNNIDYFLNLDPRKRKEEIDVLLGLDKFEIARSNIVTVINRVKYDRSTLEKRYSQESVTEIEKKFSENSKKLEELAEKRKLAQAELNGMEGNLLNLQKAFLSLKEKSEADEQLSRNQLRAEARIESIKKEISGKDVDLASHELSKKQLADAKSKRESLSGEILRLDSQFSGLQKSTAALEARIASLLSAIKQKEQLEKELEVLADGKSLEVLSEDLALIEKQVLSVSSEVRHLEAAMLETADLMKKLKPEMGQCPLCNAPLTAHSSEKLKHEKEQFLADSRKRILELKSVVADRTVAQKKISENIKRISIIKNRLDGIASDTKDLPSLESSFKQGSSELNALKAVRLDKQESLKALQKQIELLAVEISTEDSVIKKKIEYAELEKQLAVIVASRKGLLFSKDDYETSRKNLENSRLQNERVRHSFDMVTRDLSSSRELQDMLQKQMDDMKHVGCEIRYFAKLEEELAIYRNTLLEIQTTLRSSLTDAINAAMNEIWGIFYPYRNYPSIKLEVTEKDYQFKVFDGNEWRLIESMASGGERACAALTLRVALAMVLTPNLGWLILDEPTHNLDQEAVLLLSETLQLKVPEVVNQIFVITHEEALMGSDFASSYRLNRDKENAGSTIIESV